MDEQIINGTEKQKTKKGERRRSRPEVDEAKDEIKKFKENLLQSVSTGESSIISDSTSEIAIPQPARSRSASRAREALSIPANVLAELDESKLFELKEAFLLFDLDGDGCIDHNDLRGTLVSLGEKVDEQAVRNMLSEGIGSLSFNLRRELERIKGIRIKSDIIQRATNPLDFDAFVNLLGYKTLELDSEETLVAALSRWDKDNSGLISEERIRHDLMTFGDRFTEKEADYALDEAPIIQKNGGSMIDYIRFCSQLAGLRKANKKQEE